MGTMALAIVRGAFSRVKFAFKAALRLVDHTKGEHQAMATTHASEELLAAPLPELIHELGLAVAGANQELKKAPGTELLYTIDKAEIELNVAISISKETKGSIAAGGTISVFNVNASYARTYGYKEEASSRIQLSLACKPRSEPPPA